jgi:glycosyltransferase involved in cell wall biosynthesis
VVATAKACEQLGARAGHDLQVADDPAEFALQVIGLLESEALRRELGDRGRQFVETNLSWDAHGAELGKALADIIGGPARPASAPPVNPLAAAEKR